MEKEKKIEITFSEKDLPAYEKMEANCLKEGLSLQEYIMDLILTDLAWGRFSNSRKRNRKKE